MFYDMMYEDFARDLHDLLHLQDMTEINVSTIK